MKTLDLDFARISYTVEGQGPCLVLLHGFMEDMRIWDGLWNSANDLRLVCIDLPGHGNSTLKSEVNSIGNMAGAVKAVLDAENITNFTLLGHSMGGYVALETVANFPKGLNGLILMHSHAAADSAEAKNNRIRTIKAVQAGKKGFINSFIPGLFSDSKKEVLRKEIALQIVRAGEIKTEDIVASIRGMMERREHISTLKQATIPVFFISGKDDVRIPPKMVFEQVEVCNHGEVMLLSDVGHMGFYEAPEVIFPAITSFVSRCSGAYL